MSAKSRFTQCGACGEDALAATHELCTVEYRGETGRIRQKSHTCESCGATLFDETDVRENKRAWLRFKKQIDLIPLGCEIAAMRIKANLTQKAAGDLFGGGPVAFSKYENDDLIPDDAMINLLKLAIAYPETIARLAEVKQKPIRIRTFMHTKTLERLDDSNRPLLKSPDFSNFSSRALSSFRTQFNSIIPTEQEKSWTLN